MPDIDQPGDAAYRLQAERAALGSILVNPGQLGEVGRWLDPERFNRPVHQAIYAAAVAQRDAGEPVDALTVLARMKREQTFADPDHQLAPYVAGLTSVEAAPNPTAGAYYARLVLEESIRDRLREAGMRLMQASEAGRGWPTDLLAVGRREAAALDAEQRAWSDATRRDGDPALARRPELEHVVPVDAMGEAMDRRYLGDAPADRLAGEAPVIGYEARVLNERGQEGPLSVSPEPDAVDAYRVMSDGQARAEASSGRDESARFTIVECRLDGSERDLSPAELDALAARAGVEPRDPAELRREMRLVEGHGRDV